MYEKINRKLLQEVEIKAQEQYDKTVLILSGFLFLIALHVKIIYSKHSE